MQIRKMYFSDRDYLRVQVTESFKERNRGLLALDVLEQGEGLLITPCRSVHTFGMGYALDLVYLNKSLKIVKIIKSIVPNRMSIALFAHSTLELNSGEAQRLDLKLGMQLIIMSQAR